MIPGRAKGKSWNGYLELRSDEAVGELVDLQDWSAYVIICPLDTETSVS